MEFLKISGVLRRIFSESFMGRLSRRGVSRRTLKILFARLTTLLCSGVKRSRCIFRIYRVFEVNP